MSYTYMSSMMKTIRDLVESELPTKEAAQKLVQEARKPEPPLIEDLRAVISTGLARRIQQIAVNFKTAEKLLGIYDQIPVAKKKEFSTTPLGTLIAKAEMMFGPIQKRSANNKSVIDQLRDVVQDRNTGLPAPIQGIQVPYQTAKAIVDMYDNGSSGKKASISRLTMQQLLNKYSYL